MEKQEGSRLCLQWHDQIVAVDVNEALSLGQGEGVDFVTQGQYTSRSHARIERQQQYFVLIDASTNGTYVQSEDQQVTVVHRNQYRLWGRGLLGLGGPIDPADSIAFWHE